MMKMKKICKSLLVMELVATLTFMPGQLAYAAPGTLITVPLYATTPVEPNIFFTLDDSESMLDSMVVEEGTNGLLVEDGFPYTLNVPRKRYTPGGFFSLPPSTGIDPEWDKGWIFRTHHGNKNYYNPDITYTPWAGTDHANNQAMLLDADPANAYRRPYAKRFEMDLLKTHQGSVTSKKTFIAPNFDYTKTKWFIPTYYIWKDDGDGVLEETDAHTQIEIKPGNAPFPSGRDYNAEIQNFANWYSYYSSRAKAMKAAVGKIIDATDSARMGLDLFNEGHRLNPKSMSDPQNKTDLLKALYEHTSKKATPAREALIRVGKLFKNPTSGAILPKDKGGECQQNYNILVTDGYWTIHHSQPLTDPVGNSDNAPGPFSGKSYGDSNSNSLADFAMDFYKNDLRPDLDDLVPTTPGVDEAKHQHLVTYTIAFGLKGKLDPNTQKPTDIGFTWTDTAINAGKIDDLWHAAYNGRGKYLSANNADELTRSLNEIVSNVVSRAATQSAASVSTAKITAGSKVFLAEYNPKQWQGNLQAYEVQDLATGALNSTPLWNASDLLEKRKPSARLIITRNNSKGVAFKWRNLNQSQKDDLRTNPSGGVSFGKKSRARLEFIRGDRSNEGKKGYGFRERATLLGDIVNSSPVFVGEPVLRWPDQAPFPHLAGERYFEFKASQKSRQEMVYIGANDGMLHGFDANTGKERLAYIPSNLFSTKIDAGLHYLTDPAYVHQFYNDLTPTISDIYASLGGGSVGGKSWRTVLISGQRGGGRGVYALDITDPTEFKQSNANKISLWEFTHKDLGYTYSQPQIGLANNGKWVAIFGNGYNDQGAGKGKLFILDIAAGSDGTWDAGDYWVIDTGSGKQADRNGLATPALADLDGNGTIDRVYAGDLKGQMWAFDLRAKKPADWVIAGKKPLFKTKAKAPITTKPILSPHPTILTDPSNAPNIMVFFGSGQYLVPADKTSTESHYFYGIWDKGSDNLKASDLIEQTYETGFTLNGSPARVLTRNLVDYIGGDFGWQIALPDSGERSVTNSIIHGETLLFNSFVPSSSTSNICSPSSYGYRFAVDLATGGSPEAPVIDADGDGVIDEQDKAQNGSTRNTLAASRDEGYLSSPVVVRGEGSDLIVEEDGSTKSIKGLNLLPIGRYSWQEIIQ